MKKMINILFYVLKFILLIAAFALTLYIILAMYQRLDKSMIDSVSIFLPFGAILIMFLINLCLKNKGVVNSLFYNLTSCIVFSTIIVVSCRAIFDKNMVLNQIMGYNIDFTYFNDFIPFMNLMLYGLVISNLFLIFGVEKEKNSNNVSSKVIDNEMEKPLYVKIEADAKPEEII